MAKKKKTQAKTSVKTKRPRRSVAKKVSLRSAARKKRKKRVRGRANRFELVTMQSPRGLGAGSAGQSGDTQGLSEVAWTDSESVEELMEEGQSFEAEVLQGVENAPDADESEVHTREENQDDVPPEYRERD